MDYNKETEATRYGRLLAKALSGTLTGAEQADFDAWLANGDHRALYESLQNDGTLAEELARFGRYEAEQVYALFESKRAASTAKSHTLKRWLPYAAAVAFLAVAIGAWLLLGDSRQSSVDRLAAEEILPGGSRATLTFADGRTINLDEAQTGIIVGTENITYDDGSDVGPADSPHAGLTTYDLQLTTPKGGTYQITLPDGTKVWLNAASTLKYPSRFSGDSRDVILEGEAYFDVRPQVRNVETHNHASFNVLTAGQVVQVLGTEFNISAYPDEDETKTTLVEGSVAITNRTSTIVNQLRPGTQSTVHGATTAIQQVDVESYISWRNGYFYFKNTPFKDVMRQLARWYDVEVVYMDEVPQETFSGKMDRELTLNAVLKLLDVSEIRARIEGPDRLIVY